MHERAHGGSGCMCTLRGSGDKEMRLTGVSFPDEGGDEDPHVEVNNPPMAASVRLPRRSRNCSNCRLTGKETS